MLLIILDFTMFTVHKKEINLDKVFYVEAECSSFLPLWRKNTDYTKNYSAFQKKVVVFC